MRDFVDFIGSAGMAGETPGGGGGAPEWLPEGATAYANFADANYYLNGSEVAVTDLFETPTAPYDGDLFAPGSITEDGYPLGALTTAAAMATADLRELILAGSTMVFTFTETTRIDPIYVLDLPGEAASFYSILRADGLTVDAPSHSGDGVGIGSELGINKLAITITDLRMEYSINGSTVAVYALDPDEFDSVALNAVLFCVDPQASSGFWTEFVVLPVQEASALAVLSDPGGGPLQHLEIEGGSAVTRSFDATAYRSIIITSNALLESLSFPSLTTVVEGIEITSNTVLDTLDLPELVSCAGLSINNVAVPTVSLPSLETINGFFGIDTVSTLTSISLPELVSVNAIFIADNSLLASITFGSLLSVGGNADWSGNALPQAQVDALLAMLAALNGTGGTTLYENLTVNLSGGTNAVPSAAGLTSKATLEGRGCTVTVNA